MGPYLRLVHGIDKEQRVHRETRYLNNKKGEEKGHATTRNTYIRGIRRKRVCYVVSFRSDTGTRWHAKQDNQRSIMYKHGT